MKLYHQIVTLGVYAAFVSAITSVLLAQETRIVTPSSLKSVDGSSYVTPAAVPTRIQFLLPASDFAELPESQRWITGFNFRSDRTQATAVDWSFSNAQVWLSTTDKTPLTLTTEFDANHGPDKQLVNDGAISYSFLATGSPRDFADGPLFKRPFYYDPSQGNLLLEWVTIDGIPPTSPRMDVQRLSAPGNVILLNQDSATAAQGEYLNQPAAMQFRFVPVGDLNGDGILDVSDIDLLTAAVEAGDQDPRFDLNRDRTVDNGDRAVWVHDLRRTWFGDANLDGHFDSGDLVEVLAAGQYEDAIAMNSGWSTGDWNGDGDFTSTDLVTALADGGYEQGPRATVAAVPEPTTLALFAVGLIAFSSISRKRSTLV